MRTLLVVLVFPLLWVASAFSQTAEPPATAVAPLLSTHDRAVGLLNASFEGQESGYAAARWCNWLRSRAR